MDNATKSAITLAIIALLGTVYTTVDGLTDQQIDSALVDAFICPATNEAHYFYGGLSGSKQRGYPNLGSRAGYKDCKYSNGDREEWEPILDYARANGLNPYTLLSSEEDLPPTNRIYGEQKKCIKGGCWEA